jgi:hypothetical protein
VGCLQHVNPKKDLRLPFSLVRFFWASKRNERMGFGATPHILDEQKNRAKAQIKSA